MSYLERVCEYFSAVDLVDLLDVSTHDIVDSLEEKLYEHRDYVEEVMAHGR